MNRGRLDWLPLCANSSTASLAEHSVELSANFVELPSQYVVSLDRVAPNLLIDIGGHAGQISDVCLKPRLAVAH